MSWVQVHVLNTSPWRKELVVTLVGTVAKQRFAHLSKAMAPKPS